MYFCALALRSNVDGAQALCRRGLQQAGVGGDELDGLAQLAS